MRTIHLCSFSGDVVDLKPKSRTVKNLLLSLNKSPMVSTWDMSEHIWLRDLIKQAINRDFIMEINEHYPWHKFSLTESGNDFLKNTKEGE